MNDEPTIESPEPRSDFGLLDDKGEPYAEAPPEEPTDVPEGEALKHLEPEGPEPTDDDEDEWAE